MKGLLFGKVQLAAIGLLLSGAAQAAGGIAAGVKLGTTGIGLEATTAITPVLNARATVNLFNYSYDATEDGIEYDAKLKLQTFGGMLDWHPFGSTFRITGGLLANGNKADLKATCPQQCEVGDLSVQGGSARIDGKLDFNKTAPYLGIGWGNAMTGGNWFGSFDLGVLFQGEPKAQLAGSGVAASVRDNNTGLSRSNVDIGNDPMVQSAIADEETSLQEEVKDFKFYPVVSVGFGYRF